MIYIKVLDEIKSETNNRYADKNHRGYRWTCKNPIN